MVNKITGGVNINNKITGNTTTTSELNKICTTVQNTSSINENYTNVNKETEMIDLSIEENNIFSKFISKLEELFAEVSGKIERMENNAAYLEQNYNIKVEPTEIKTVEKYNKTDAPIYTVTLKDGTVIKINTAEASNAATIFKDDGTQIRSYKDGIKYIRKENESPDIFDYNNTSNEQYGGNQMEFKYNNATLIQDERVQNIIRSYWPEATLENMELLLYKICSSGCGYIALTNTIFEKYEGKEKEFKEKFGFSMYNIKKDGSLDYNYELLALEYYCYIWGNSGYSIEEIHGNIKNDANDGALSKEKSGGLATGTTKETQEEFANFLKEKYDIEMDVYSSKSLDKTSLNNEVIKNYYNSVKNENNQLIISVSGSDLYNMDGTLTAENVGGHSMYITGISQNGNIIVSSWGKDYILNLNTDTIEWGWVSVITG